MLHKLKTVKPRSLLIFSTSLVALLIMSPLPFFWIHSGSWISKWSKSFWRRFTSTFRPIPKTICLEKSLIKPIHVANKINHNDFEITKSEENPFCNWSIMFFTSKGITTLNTLTIRRANAPYKNSFLYGLKYLDITLNFSFNLSDMIKIMFHF